MKRTSSPWGQNRQPTAATAQPPAPDGRRSSIRFNTPDYHGGSGGQRRTSQPGNGDEILPAPRATADALSGRKASIGNGTGRRRSSNGVASNRRKPSTAAASSSSARSQRVSLGDPNELNPESFLVDDPLVRRGTDLTIKQAGKSLPFHQRLLSGRPNGFRARLAKKVHPSSTDGGVRRVSETATYLHQERYARNSQLDDWEQRLQSASQHNAPHPKPQRDLSWLGRKLGLKRN